MTETTGAAAVWSWLPGGDRPSLAGEAKTHDDGRVVFRYLDDPDAGGDGRRGLPKIGPDVPRFRDRVLPLSGMTMAGSLRDASPDAWGRRVVRQRTGSDDDLDEIGCLLAAGSDRIGALHVQVSPDVYEEPAHGSASLDELEEDVGRIESGHAGPTAFDGRIGVGGARPKALVELDGRKWIAKFHLRSDHQNVVKAEFVAMRLAALCGLDVASVRLERTPRGHALLIERFDRVRSGDGWLRKGVVSGLTMLGLDEMMARYASYQDVASVIREKVADPGLALRELFSRLTFNVLIGNTDDHARNHAFLWDGFQLSLSPAYDVCPQSRHGDEASQAMMIAGSDRSSRLVTCLAAAKDFGLQEEEALELMIGQVSTIGEKWGEVADEAELAAEDKAALVHRSVLNQFALYDCEDRRLWAAYWDAVPRLR